MRCVAEQFVVAVRAVAERGVHRPRSRPSFNSWCVRIKIARNRYLQHKRKCLPLQKRSHDMKQSWRH